MLSTKPFLHKGLADFWETGSKAGITASWETGLRALLNHLASAMTLEDVKGGLGRLKHLEALSGHVDRYSLEINKNFRLTFDWPADGNSASKIDIEDFHGGSGAKRH